MFIYFFRSMKEKSFLKIFILIPNLIFCYFYKSVCISFSVSRHTGAESSSEVFSRTTGSTRISTKNHWLHSSVQNRFQRNDLIRIERGIIQYERQIENHTCYLDNVGFRKIRLAVIWKLFLSDLL